MEEKRFVLTEIKKARNGGEYVGKKAYYYNGPKTDIHEGRQALLEAMLKGSLRECLRYGVPKGGELFITRGLNLGKEGDMAWAGGEIHLIFAPPEPEDKTLAYLLAHRPKCVSQEIVEWLEQVLGAKDEN